MPVHDDAPIPDRQPTDNDRGTLQDGEHTEEIVPKEVVEEEQLITEPVLRKGTREQKKSTIYSAHEYVLLTDGEEPESFERRCRMKTCKSGWKRCGKI